jgi:[citrate (pro-3S)-lyase] ligase
VYKLEKYTLNEICTIDVNEEINKIGLYFLSNAKETIFIIDSERFLHGIITIGDYSRKISSAKSVIELMNSEYIKIEHNIFTSDMRTSLTANEIFKNNPSINAIPVIENRKLLYVYVRNNFYYDKETIEKILMLRNDSKIVEDFLQFASIKRAAVIAENEILVFIGEILRKYIIVDEFKNFEEFEQSKIEFDLVWVNNMMVTQSSEAKKLIAKEFFIIDARLLYSYFIPLMEKMLLIKKIVDKIDIFFIPRVYDIKNPSEIETYFKRTMRPNRSDDVICEGLFKSNDEQTKKDYVNKLAQPYNLIQRKGELCWNDVSTEYVNIVNGRRITTDDNDDYTNKLFVLGNSCVQGFGSEDKYTIPSCMQRIFNKSDTPYKVINCGVSGGISLYNVFEEAKKGDRIIVVLGGNSPKLFKNSFDKQGQPYLNIHLLTHIFDRPHNMGEVYFDTAHINHIGNEKIAVEICNIIRMGGGGIVKRNGSEFINSNKKEELMKKGLSDFLDGIKKFKIKSKNVGAVVMNCNPFTYGHRHLIEYASSQVEHLYIFIVEENKSFFTFEDRFTLVTTGLSDISNITILPSGKFIISAVTFEEYFDKDALQDIAINPSLDIEIFAKYIAPMLNIKKRFAGEEPNCYITSQYNNIMRQILPKYGIEFVEIPRKELGGKPISASYVRKMIEEKNILIIKDIVPPCTFNFIKFSNLL